MTGNSRMLGGPEIGEAGKPIFSGDGLYYRALWWFLTTSSITARKIWTTRSGFNW